MQTEMMGLTKFRDDTIWLDQRYLELIKEHNNEYIAVKDKKIIASGKDLERVLKETEKKGINPAFVLVEFISEKVLKMII